MLIMLIYNSNNMQHDMFSISMWVPIMCRWCRLSNQFIFRTRPDRSISLLTCLCKLRYSQALFLTGSHFYDCLVSYSGFLLATSDTSILVLLSSPLLGFRHHQPCTSLDIHSLLTSKPVWSQRTIQIYCFDSSWFHGSCLAFGSSTIHYTYRCEEHTKNTKIESFLQQFCLTRMRFDKLFI